MRMSFDMRRRRRRRWKRRSLGCSKWMTTTSLDLTSPKGQGLGHNPNRFSNDIELAIQKETNVLLIKAWTASLMLLLLLMLLLFKLMQDCVGFTQAIILISWLLGSDANRWRRLMMRPGIQGWCGPIIIQGYLVDSAVCQANSHVQRRLYDRCCQIDLFQINQFEINFISQQVPVM